MKKKQTFFYYAILFVLTAALNTCTYDKEGLPLPASSYPDEIAKILVPKCATSGCHNTQSKIGAGGFDLSSWDHLFEGGTNGSSVIPYRADQSYFMYFINTYADLGISLTPVMPKNATPLSHDEVLTVRNWIRNGAPDRNGNIKFSGDPFRKKFYVCNQGCDLVTVFDSRTKLPMRIIEVGANPNQVESPHDIIVSPDGKFWYVIFLTGHVMQKFRTSDDSLAGEVTLGNGQWTSMTITEDSRYAFVVNYSPDPDGSVAFVDLQTMTLQSTYQGLRYPHGSAVSEDGKTLYITAQFGNYIYKYDISNPWSPQETDIRLENGPQVFVSKFDPHQIGISPDETKYYVSCQYSNEVRVMSVAADTLIAVIPTGGNPQELEFSENYPYLFVSCMNDTITNPGLIGTVSVINYNSDAFIKSIYTGWQPHGLNVDDQFGLVYVANRNINPNGDAPHHTSACGGRNGNITIIDMTSPDPYQMDLLPDYKVEVSVDPYEIGIRK
ncbi:MAG: hypothetical protein NT126_05245 [Bacteroidetes bacterium]|nr:hypothetical protein [Bacteroidota bacterium]